jgi:hypothetical protein
MRYLIVFILFAAANSYGQNPIFDTLKAKLNYKIPKNSTNYIYQLVHPSKRDSLFCKEMDLEDFLFTRKAKKKKTTTQKKKIYISLFPAAGVSPSASQSIITLGNAAFYLADNNHTHLSSVSFGVVYAFDNSFAIPIRFSIWTPKNKLYFYGDWRYLNYPEKTFGLGGSSKSEDVVLLRYSYFRFYQTAMKRIKNHWFGGVGYQLDYHFNLNETEVSQNDGSLVSHIEPGVSSGITFNVLGDNRHNSINPQGGYYFTSFYRINHQVFGSDNNWQSLYADYRKYFKVGKKTNILALSAFGWFTFSGKPPYLDNPAIGWDAYSRSGRGYSQGRFRGADMIYAESEFRFNLTCNGLIGAVVFMNISSYSEPVSHNFNMLLPSAGTGLRIKINKFSRTNFAIDFGKGLYDQWNIWLNVGEVF